ncbi:hypothetical protein A5784_10450 [Mycobacterium sp. 852013-50091_SCH5140682]|nr:hypothetical protein A5784_10450 [Mycobacterium sp. 852013-50091_SCH5140682]
MLQEYSEWLSDDPPATVTPRRSCPDTVPAKGVAVTLTIPYRPADMMNDLLHEQQSEQPLHDSHDHARHESRGRASRRIYFESGLLAREMDHP